MGEVIACSYVGNAATIFKQLVDADELLIEGTLFSRPEQEYLDFMLNVQKFGNGPEIRNKYAHGTNSLDPKIQENDYFELLKIMVMIMVMTLLITKTLIQTMARCKILKN